MKKFTLITFLFLISMRFASAQTIPNPSFENWTNYANGEYPTSWQTSDSASFGISSAHSAEKELVEKCHLSYAVKLTTFSAFGLATVPGVATNGNIAVGLSGIAISGGSPDNVRNDTLKGCYEYIPAGSGNTAVISAYLLKRNGANRDTIAAAVWMPPASASPMQNFAIPFVYRSGQFPDSILVILSSSLGVNTEATAGSVLIVDNLSLAGTLNSVPENVSIKDIKVYPTPATGRILNVDVTFGRYVKSTYSLIDGIGRVVLSGDLREKQQIDIASLTNGIYSLVLIDDSGQTLYSTRVTVNR